MEKTSERKMRAHERGVAVLSKLAVSFGVNPTVHDHERWAVLLSLSREIDDASLKEGFYAGSCHKALMSGKEYAGYIPQELSGRFKKLYDNSGQETKEALDGFVHGIAQRDAAIREHRLDRADVARPGVDHKGKISDFQAALEDDARYRARLLALPLVGAPEDEAAYRDENGHRVEYNAWLEDFFYVAYEHAGAFAHAGADRRKKRHSMESVGGQAWSQAWLACRSLARCISYGKPRTTAVLLAHGSARFGRKLVGKL